MQKSRVASHSHIIGLGLKDGAPVPVSDGMAYQEEAREGAGLILQLIKSKKMSGRAVCIVGGSGTGKTAIALGISKELGRSTPFTSMTASEVFSSEIKKTEVLMQHLRRSIGLRIKEIKEVYEGEVTELKPLEIDNPLQGYGKAISHVVVTLRSVKGSKTLKMDSSIYESVVKEGVQIGDVIYIEANSGQVKRVGRSDLHAAEFDLEADDYVPLPKGEVYKKKEIVQDVTLHDLDVANAQPNTNAESLTALMSGMIKHKKTEITEKLRTEINKIVSKYIEQGVAELVPGVLFIDEVHMLDIECFTFLNRALESQIAPVVALATNKGMCKVRGTDIESAHGIPSDFLDRLLIIRTKQYTQEQMKTIIDIRAKTEGVKLDADSLQMLSEIAVRSSLRFAVQLMTPARILSRVAARDHVTVADLQEVDSLFMDAKASSQQL